MIASSKTFLRAMLSLGIFRIFATLLRLRPELWPCWARNTSAVPRTKRGAIGFLAHPGQVWHEASAHCGEDPKNSELSLLSFQAFKPRKFFRVAPCFSSTAKLFSRGFNHRTLLYG